MDCRSASAAGMGLCHGMEVSTSAKVPHAEFFPPPPSPRGPSLWLARLDEDRRAARAILAGHPEHGRQELRVRYQRSILGFVWTLLNPLLMMVILSWVFSYLDEGHRELSALPVRRHGSLELPEHQPERCAVCIIQNEGLIRKIYLPKLVFPLARVLISLVTFVLSLGALFLLLWPLGARLSSVDAALPVAIVLLAMFTLGLGLIVATANTFYPRLRPSGLGVLAGVVFRDADLVSDRRRFQKARSGGFVSIRRSISSSCFTTSCTRGNGLGSAWWRRPRLIAAASLGIGYAIFKSHEDKMVFRL